MSALLPVFVGVTALGVVGIIASLLSWAPAGRHAAGLSAEDQVARVVTIPRSHGDDCPWATAAFPRLRVFGEESVSRVLAQDTEVTS